MSLRRQRQVLKLSELDADPKIRQKLIEGIIRRKHRKVKLYAWKVDPSDNLAERAFFSQRAALTDWYAQERIWEEDEPPKGVVIHEWEICVDDLIPLIKGGKVLNSRLTEDARIEVATMPSDLYGDIQQALKR
jgi:hypothetical protein